MSLAMEGAGPLTNDSPSVHHVDRGTWERAVRRCLLGFYNSAKKDPKKWVRHGTVLNVGMAYATWSTGNTGADVRPSAELVAQLWDLDVTTVRACVKRLRQLELFECIKEGRPAGRAGGPGIPPEYRLTLPENLSERVAHWSGDYKNLTLVVPHGVDMPPERSKPVRQRKEARGAAPCVSQERQGAAPSDSRNDEVLPLERRGAAPPQPSQSPTQENLFPPGGAGAPAPEARPLTAQTVVAAYVEGVISRTGERPTGQLIGKISKQAKDLVEEGRDHAGLVTAARSLGQKVGNGFTDLGQEYLMLLAGPSSRPDPRYAVGTGPSGIPPAGSVYTKGKL